MGFFGITPPPQYQKIHQNMLIIPPNAGHGFAALYMIYSVHAIYGQKNMLFTAD